MDKVVACKQYTSREKPKKEAIARGANVRAHIHKKYAATEQTRLVFICETHRSPMTALAAAISAAAATSDASSEDCASSVARRLRSAAAAASASQSVRRNRMTAGQCRMRQQWAQKKNEC